MKKLSIILPAYNEGQRIETSVAILKKKADELAIDYEIIIVNDGSSDSTLAKAQVCASDNVKILSYGQNRGKGYAIRHGMLNSEGQYKLFMDVDLSTSLESLKEFLELMEGGQYDVIIGDRKSHSARLEVKQPLYRVFFGKGFTFLAILFIGHNVNDFTCGFKMYTKEAADIIFKRQQIFNWAFDAELVYIAFLHALRVHEAPVTWRHYGNSKVRLFRDITRSLHGLITLRINALKGLYK